ncbi:MAG TPA: hypothetical protein PK819_02855, partial [Thermomicrobiales bacterium]|nr:hypothetical protein [Thermomicrobiales bacterium]
MAATTIQLASGDDTTDVWSAVRLLQQMRRRRRSHLIGSQSVRSARRLIVVATIVVPGASFLFMGFAIAMAIAFGKSQTQDQAEALLATMLLVSFATALAGCLSTALQSLFMSQDVRFLVSLPLPVRAIYYDRFGDVARGAIPGSIFGLSICVGYVLGRAQDYRFVVFGMVAVFLLTATAISLAASTTAITVRLSSPTHSRRILIAASLVILVLTAVTWRLTGAASSDSPDHPVIQAILGTLPSGWARSALVRSVGPDPQTALPFVALQVGILILVTVVGAKAFATTFTENIERTDLGAVRMVRRRSSPVARRLLGLVPRTSVHWVRREWILISRDFGRVSAAILPVGSVVVWIIISFFWTSGTGVSGNTFWLTHAP